MITIDPRIGSADLYPLLKARSLPCQLEKLDYGDLAWVWNGPDGRPISVGVERKRIGDLLSCVKDGRFAGHQLPGLLASYEFVYLLIEGIYRCSPDGLLETKQGEAWAAPQQQYRPARYMDIEGWITTMETQANIRVIRSSSDKESAAKIHAKYAWGTAKAWEEHRSHLSMDNSNPPPMLIKASFERRVAAQIPGIDWQKSQCVADAFRTVQEMVEASEKEWAALTYLTKKTKKTEPHAMRLGIVGTKASRLLRGQKS